MSKIISLLKSAWERIERWLGRSQAPVIDAGVGKAIDALLNAGVKDRDWFVWECTQYMEAPVWWLNPYRYHATEWAYPWPEQHSINAVFDMSRQRAVARYGSIMVDEMGRWVAMSMPYQGAPDAQYARSPDPVGQAMRDWSAATGQGVC